MILPVSVQPFAPFAAQDSSAHRSLDTWATGRLCEISCDGSGGQSTLAATWVLACQRAGQPVAWLMPRQGALYPPDLAAHGICLAALVVVRVGDAHAPADRVRAAQLLLQSGGFGLVVVDGTDAAWPTGWGWQGQLLAQARSQQAAVLLLTRKARSTPSLGAWVALRVVPQQNPGGDVPLGQRAFDLAVLVDKNKGAPGFAPANLARRGPEGLL